MFRFIRRISLGLLILAFIGLLVLYIPAHWQIRQIEPTMPTQAELFAALNRDATSGPVSIRYINTASQSSSLANLSHVGVLLTWANGNSFLIDSGMDAESAIAFGNLLKIISDAGDTTTFGSVAEQLGADKVLAKRAGLLSKTDLMSDMVLEFPQVQGTMGKYYAIHDGEEQAVAQALEDQYRPRFAGDNLPEGNIGCSVAIADKVDTLVGIFGINQPPKGDKDPFALRRAAIGLIRIIIEKQLDLDIADLVAESISLYGDKLSNENTQQDVLDFVLGRFKAHYQEQNISVDVIQAVLANAPTAPLDFEKRISAVSHFKSMSEAETLAAANKRVGNILAKFNGELFSEFKSTLATEQAEIDLANTFATISNKVQPLQKARDYKAVLAELSQIKQPIDEFFDNVMVMADDEQVKINRLTLLSEIRNSFLAIADISLLQS